MYVAPASNEFSTNSFTTEAGLSITSQALSLVIIYSGNLRIGITYVESKTAYVKR